EEEEYPSFDSYPQSFEPIYPDIFSEDESRFDEEEVVNSDYGESPVFDDDQYEAKTENIFGDLIKSLITVGSPINFKWQNKDNSVVAKNAQRKDYEGSTTTSLDVLNSLSSKIATTKCVWS
nr:hypothetical protein [Tanacetum cinerariifolium]